MKGASRVVEVLLTLSALSLVAALGSTQGALAALGLLGCALGWWTQRPPAGPAAEALTLAVAAVLCALGFTGVLGLLEAAQVLLVVMLAVRAWCRPTPEDLRLVWLLTLVAFLYASSFSWWSTWLVVAGAVLGVVLPAALALVSLEDHDPTLPVGRALALPVALTVVLAGVLFVILPRAPTPFTLPGLVSAGGFSRAVALGDLAIARNASSVVARVRTPGGTAEPPWLRGQALDVFDGRGWTVWRPPRQRVLAASAGGPVTAISLRRMKERMVFVPAGAVAVDPEGGAEVVPVRGGYRYDGPRRPLRYRVWGGGVATADRHAYRHLGVPGGLSPEVRALAARWTRNASDPRTRAEAIVGHLQRDFRYELTGTPFSRQPLERFLFQRRAGPCEYFATTLAILLRATGVPAVLVVGFRGGEWDPAADVWVVRASHAHAWVEVWLGDEGWVAFDPSPPAVVPPPGPLTRLLEELLGGLSERLVGFDAEQQAVLLRRALPALGTVTLGCIAALALIAVRRRRPRGGRVARMHRRARRTVVRRGWSIPPELPAVDAARWLVEAAGEGARPLEALAWLHHRVRFGGTSEGQHADEARQCLEALRRGLPRRG